MLTCANRGLESPDGFRYWPACAAPLDQPVVPAREQGLLRAVPRLVPGRVSAAAAVVGDPPSPIDLPTGCPPRHVPEVELDAVSA